MKPNTYKILIIDDEIGIINALKTVLSNKYFVEGITTSHGGIQRLKEEKFDLLIVDFYIDDMNGHQVVESVRKFNKDIYIMLLTGYKEDVPGSTALENMDIQCYCEKGSDFERILISIESALKSINFFRKIECGFASRLKEIRKYHNLSQDDLAKYLEVRRTTIANYESGFSEPSIEIIKKIASYFNVSTDYLLGHSIEFNTSRNLDK